MPQDPIGDRPKLVRIMSSIRQKNITAITGVNVNHILCSHTHLGPAGPRWAPCWPHELCYLGRALLGRDKLITYKMKWIDQYFVFCILWSSILKKKMTHRHLICSYVSLETESNYKWYQDTVTRMTKAYCLPMVEQGLNQWERRCPFNIFSHWLRINLATDGKWAITKTSRSLKSPASRLFIQELAQTNIKEITKAPQKCALWWESTGHRWIPLAIDQ